MGRGARQNSQASTGVRDATAPQVALSQLDDLLDDRAGETAPQWLTTPARPDDTSAQDAAGSSADPGPSTSPISGGNTPPTPTSSPPTLDLKVNERVYVTAIHRASGVRRRLHAVGNSTTNVVGYEYREDVGDRWVWTLGEHDEYQTLAEANAAANRMLREWEAKGFDGFSMSKRSL